MSVHDEPLELDEDPETLRAALAMIDALSDDSTSRFHRIPIDSTNSDGFDSIDQEVSSTFAPPPRQHQPRKTNASRNRRVAEISYLREKVTYLQAALDALISRRQEEKHAPPTQAIVDRVATRMWKDIASRQSRHRQQAELENAKLRGKLRSQLQTSRELIRLLRNAITDQEEHVATHSLDAAHVDCDLRATTEELLVQVDELYRQRASAFTSPAFECGMSPLEDIKITEIHDDHADIKIQLSWTLPFGMEGLWRAMWIVMQKKMEMKGAHIEYISQRDGSDPDTMVVKFTQTASDAINHLENLNVKGKMITKKFAEKCRDSNVVTSCTMVTTTSAELVTGDRDATFYEESTLRVREIPGVAEFRPSSSPLCQMQTNRTIRLGFTSRPDSSTKTWQHRVGVLTELVLTHVDAELHLRQNLIESVLFQPTQIL